MIPKDILIQIFEKLPVESLLRFKCVSKVWYNMIEDQEFVDGFRVRAHNRGTNLLVRKSRFQKNTDEENNTGVNHSQVYTFFLVDSEGKSVPLAFPDILRETSFRLHQPVEGLLCCNNIIWNPTTRKFIDLPPRNQMPDAWKISEKMGTTRGYYGWNIWSEYFLGFDVSTKKHKVLSICHVRLVKPPIACKKGDYDAHVYAEVLTLGTNCWKKISIDISLEQDLCESFEVKSSCSINGVIYSIITVPCKLSIMSTYMGGCILAFDISREKLRLLPFPEENVYVETVAYPGELGGRFALMEVLDQKIWILEEVFEGGRWTSVDLSLPKRWCDPHEYERGFNVYPMGMGSDQDGEILFRVSEICLKTRRDFGATIFSYNMESKDMRKITELDDFLDSYDDIVFGLVETIHPLK
ncbi:putative F-box protein At1g19160 [Coffea eugenioides]|uniref:putative F-box protein At1g19160 n=1 Tax=Coffea eugenioides TaxID=49369 RepID=UPI000F6113E1|nr:putative F-box protein At1g19160 [Coffea eugenioides]